MQRPDYAKHYEILIALVTHLAVHKWAMRQPKGIADDLSIYDVDAVRHVLQTFKGLFRESDGKSKDHGDHFYSLHLRHARGSIGPSQEDRPGLDTDDLFSLLKLISERSNQQSQQSTALRVAAATSIISLLVATASVIVAFYKR